MWSHYAVLYDAMWRFQQWRDWKNSILCCAVCNVKPLCCGKGNGKGRYSSSWEPHLTATGRHLPYGITQSYLPPGTSEHALPNPSHAGRYSIYLPLRDGRLSWPSWLDSAPARSRTSDLSITSARPNHCTTETADNWTVVGCNVKALCCTVVWCYVKAWCGVMWRFQRT